MVATQIAARGVVDPRVLSAMRKVPREAFLPAAQGEQAYADNPGEATQAALQSARADLASARGSLVNARAARAQTLLSGHQQVQSQRAALAAAHEQLASARASVALNEQGATASEVANAQAQVDAAPVTVEPAATALAATVLRAPVAGTVAEINGSVGQAASSTTAASSTAGSTSTSSTASGFVTLTSTHVLEVTAYIAEADIDSVHTGQRATVTLSASERELQGEVTAVDTVQTVTNNVVEYGVTVRLDRTQGVKLGASSEVVITTGSKDDVLRVSSSALTTVGNTTTATVLADDGTTSTVPVEVGLQGDSQTQVISGLSAGDVLVVPESEDSSTGFTFPGGGPVPGGGAPQ